MPSFPKKLTFILLCLILAACSADSDNSDSPTPTPPEPIETAPEVATEAAPTEAPQEEAPQEGGSENTADLTAALDAPFTLEPGQSAALETTGMTITFDMVVTDVRCPTEVDCFQDGPVIVQISAETSDGSSSTFEMNPNPQLAALEGNPPNIVTFQGFEIELTAVDPYPAQPEDIMNMDYTATLVVREGS